jgi:hypothetical protein
MSATKLIIATSAILLMAATLVAKDDSRAGSDATSTSVAALKGNLGNPAGLVIDEVRVTDTGVACIEYRVNNEQGRKIRGNAVVQGDEVLKSAAGDERFTQAWDQHCLGPRGGMTGGN